MNGSTTSSETKAAESAPKKVRKPKVIKSGMFFKLSEKEAKDGVGIVMVMGAETMLKGNENDEVKYICAVVRPAADTNGAYELFVAKQRVIEGKHLSEEMQLEYDIHTRYYLVKGT
jgi:kinesin family protein 2/24